MRELINTLTKRFHKPVGCLSFTIFNIFENKKGVIKILVYTSVNDIYQINVIFFAITILD